MTPDPSGAARAPLDEEWLDAMAQAYRGSEDEDWEKIPEDEKAVERYRMNRLWERMRWWSNFPAWGALVQAVEDQQRQIAKLEHQPQPVRMVTCHTCQREAPSHAAYRCYDCGGWFDEEHAQQHFAKTTTSVRADVTARLETAEAEVAQLRADGQRLREKAFNFVSVNGHMFESQAAFDNFVKGLRAALVWGDAP